MKLSLIKMVSMLGLGVLAACGSGTPSEPSKLGKCAAAAGIKGQISVETTVVGGKTIQKVVPGAGVSEAQASKATACLAE